jgi:CheY-like chemotaxis protein
MNRLPPQTRPHVLVLNDNQEILDLLGELLQEEGYRVTTSLILLNAARVRALAPDLIMLDLVFGGREDGWEFLTMVRLDPPLAHVPLVLCTAAVEVIRDDAMAAKLERLGVRVVLKPFDLAELLGVLQAASASRRREAALADQAAHSPAGQRPGLPRP